MQHLVSLFGISSYTDDRPLQTDLDLQLNQANQSLKVSFISSCCMDERNNAGHPSSNPPSEVIIQVFASLGGLLEG